MKKIILIFLILINLLISCKSKQIFNPEQFTDFYKNKLIDEKIFSKVSIDNELYIKAEVNNTVYDFNLNNVYKDYLKNTNKINEIIKNKIEYDLGIIYNKFHFNIKEIVPVLKNVLFINESLERLKKLNISEDKFDLYYKKINDEIILLYAIDSEKNLKYLTKSEIPETLNIDKLFDISINNLKRKLPKINKRKINNLYILEGENFGSSFIFENEIWNNKYLNVKGEYIFSVPSRGIVLITGNSDLENIIKIKKMTVELYNSNNHSISDKIFIKKNNNFIEYK